MAIATTETLPRVSKPEPSKPEPSAVVTPTIWRSPERGAQRATRVDTPTATARLRRVGELPARVRPRVGLPAKISLFLALILLPLAGMTWTLSERALRTR